MREKAIFVRKEICKESAFWEKETFQEGQKIPAVKYSLFLCPTAQGSSSGSSEGKEFKAQGKLKTFRFLFLWQLLSVNLLRDWGQFAAVGSQHNSHTLGSPDLISEPKAEGPIQLPLLKNSLVTEHDPCLLLLGCSLHFLTSRMP